jgi:hypothetical protein
VRHPTQAGAQIVQRLEQEVQAVDPAEGPQRALVENEKGYDIPRFGCNMQSRMVVKAQIAREEDDRGGHQTAL